MMTENEKRIALADYLIGLQSDMESKFGSDVCENWSLDGFLEHIDECISDISEEIEDDTEL
jgi:hypothetical protein